MCCLGYFYISILLFKNGVKKVGVLCPISLLYIVKLLVMLRTTDIGCYAKEYYMEIRGTNTFEFAEYYHYMDIRAFA